MTRHHSVSAGAVVIRDDGRILAVQRRDTGAWVTPGGILEPGEALTDGAIREVLEETGIDIELDGLVGIYQNLATDVVTFVFRAHPSRQQPPLASVESSHTRWLTPAEAEPLMSQPFLTRINDALTGGEPVVRTISVPHLMAPRAD